LARVTFQDGDLIAFRFCFVLLIYTNVKSARTRRVVYLKTTLY